MILSNTEAHDDIKSYFKSWLYRVDSIVIAENDVGWEKERRREIVAPRALDIKWIILYST